MKIFLSWSGARSLKVAVLLKGWINCVLQSARPWVSSQNIDRGALWFAEIGEQLKDTSVGIICLTAENKNKPWILFEAGALAKGLSASRVCPLLIDLDTSDIQDPLAQFNCTLPDRDSLFKLVQTLNSSLGEHGLADMVLERVFDTYWPQFERDFAKIIAETESEEVAPPRSSDDILAEILKNTRAMSARISKLESQKIATKADVEYDNLWKFRNALTHDGVLLGDIPISAWSKFYDDWLANENYRQASDRLKQMTKQKHEDSANTELGS